MARKRRYWLGAVALLPLAAILYGVVASTPCARLNLDADGARIAVVLGAGMAPDGQLHASTLGRVAAGVELYQRGVVSSLHMTGGRAAPGGPAAGDQMAAAAVALGAPSDRITTEGESLSTLQNALFSKPMLDADRKLVLVSHGFHLSRAWLSFAWAGRVPEAVCHHARLRGDPTQERHALLSLAREYLASWFNLGRVSLYSLAGTLGAQQDPSWLQ